MPPPLEYSSGSPLEWMLGAAAECQELQEDPGSPAPAGTHQDDPPRAALPLPSPALPLLLLQPNTACKKNKNPSGELGPAGRALSAPLAGGHSPQHPAALGSLSSPSAMPSPGSVPAQPRPVSGCGGMGQSRAGIWLRGGSGDTRVTPTVNTAVPPFAPPSQLGAHLTSGSVFGVITAQPLKATSFPSSTSPKQTE